MRIDVLGVKFDNLTMDEAVSKGMELINKGEKGYVVTPNPEIVWSCRNNEELKRAVDNAYLVLPDGIGVVYGAKILGRPLKSRVPGIDFVSGMFSELAKDRKRVFLFGAKPGVAEKAAENIGKQYPGLVMCGTNDGYFKDDAPIIEKINNAKPDLLLVCLGFPKQENWMRANMDRLNVHLMAGLGGSLDVFAGTVERAPEKWQKLGLEWFYRLLKEPKRIKRMSILPAFLFKVVLQRIRGK